MVNVHEDDDEGLMAKVWQPSQPVKHEKEEVKRRRSELLKQP